MSRIIAPVSAEEFNRLLKLDIVIGPHALEHLSAGQRKVFKPEELLRPLQKEQPSGVGRQRNGRYAAYYRRHYGYLKLILEATHSRLEIVTFMITATMPNLRR